MKINSLLISFIIFSSSVFSQKVLDKSGKKPDWLGSLVKDYIIAIGSSSSLEAAKENALNYVKSSIVTSVADNIKAQSEMKKSEINDKYTEEFNTKVTSMSAKLPYVNGISLNKVTEFYWEKIKNKKTGVESFNYHIKYPFSELELNKIIMDFKLRDREMTEQLNTLLSKIDSIETTEDISKAIDELTILKDYFIDSRQQQAESGIVAYQNLYSQISLFAIEESFDKIILGLKIGNKIISTNQKPRTKSNCAKIVSNISNGKNWEIKYTDENCYENDDNNLKIEFIFGGKNTNYNINVNPALKNANINLSGDIIITSIESTENNINKINIEFNINSKFENKIKIEKIVFDFEEQEAISIEATDIFVNKKGINTVKIESKCNLNKLSSSSLKKPKSLKGNILYKNISTNEVKTLKFFEQKYKTNW